ncbi:MAG: hypothetical protein FJY56_18625 [Betaproteobacteria bacterium]|nr:hypothetical protein [Betaproteobacteria bacterium]
MSLTNDPLLIIEGEDDERVWQQATRASQGRIRLFPVVATSVDQQSALELFCAPLLRALYDDPIVYSLRDGDGNQTDLDPVGPVIRFRLRCYAIENLLVTDECLTVLKTTWPKFQESAKKWAHENQGHRDAQFVRQLSEAPDRMRKQKIKQIRQLICAIADSKKPWEVVVGQAIGGLDPTLQNTGEAGLLDFIGAKASQSLLKITNLQLPSC